MKFVIATQEFNYLINKCLSVVGAKPTVPILANLLIEAANGYLTITATDLSIGIRCTTEAKILQEGATTLPAKKLAQLVRELKSVNLEITTGSNEITEIIADTSRFKLHGMSKTEFPSLPDMENGIEAKLPQSEFKEMLFRTAFAVSRDDNRYVLTGVNMNINNCEASFVGTDGKRLARSKTRLEVDPAFTASYIIPIKAVEEIIKNLEDEGDVTLQFTTDKIAVKGPQIEIVAKLLTGDYPDVSRVIPEHSTTIISLHRDELSILLRQVALFTADAAHSVKFAFSDGELQLSANTSDFGEGKVSMPVNYQGQKLEVAFNPIFFLDILRHTKEDTVSMGVTDAYNPGIITDAEQIPAGASALRSLFVLMPMRLNEE